MIQVEAKNITPIDKILTMGDADSSYHVVVKINSRIVWSGEVHHHDRMNGWGQLLRLVAAHCEQDRVTKAEPLNKPSGYRNLLDGSVQDEQ